jgi:glycosyltransferase involved in cell wall biosynthesis
MSSKRPLSASSLTPPAIRVLPLDDGRPFWSVMIPTFNPRADYLEETLRSVLRQDLGPEQMQIEVVDDRSTHDVAAQTVGRVAGGRVSFHAEPRNRGLAETWNRCIERAQGHWVHILHQDDIVLPGFYERLREGAEQSDAGAIFCRYSVTSCNGHRVGISELHRESAGLLDDWHAKITAQQLIQCPAIAVRRLVYEQLGGFLPQLHYTPDWEMWQRVASEFSFWFEPSILASYRVHPNSATSRMRLNAADIREVREVIDLTTAYHSPARGRMLARKARSFYAELAILHAREMLVETGFRPAWKQVIEALRLCRSRRIIWQIFSFFVLWFRIIASRLKRLMKPKANAPGHS